MSPQNRTLIVDNGSYTIKAGFSSPETTPEYSHCELVPNCIARTRDRRSLVGSQLLSCRDFGGMAFRRPVEKGYLVNWEAEKEIWDRMFLDEGSVVHCEAHETRLVLTEAPNPPLSLQNNCDQMVFEEYEFEEYLRCTGPSVIPWNDIPALFESSPTTYSAARSSPAEAVIVIDTGFSHTHIVPTLLGNPWNAGIRRIDIGGKFLTNYLKELVSLRTWNMMDEPYLISQVKEAVCYVAKDFSADLEKCKRLRNAPAYRNDIVREYVLPNYNTPGMGIGYARIPTSSSSTAPTSKSLETPETNTEEQIMTLSNERFTVPELLFHPSDVGLTQAGIAECTTQSLSTVPDRFHPVLLANIVLVGGNAAIPGFKDRFVQEIRSLVDVNMHVRVGVPQEPVKYTWMGAARMAADERVMAKKVVSRAEYGEHGLVWAQRRMAGEEVRGGGDVVEKETAPVKDTITSTRSERRESRSHKKRRVTDASS